MNKKSLNRGDLLDMRSVLERQMQRIERKKAEAAGDPAAEHHAEMLAREIAAICAELDGQA